MKSKVKITFFTVLFLSILLFMSLFSSEKPDPLEKIAHEYGFDHTEQQNTISLFFENNFVDTAWMTPLLAAFFGTLVTALAVVMISKLINNKNAQ